MRDTLKPYPSYENADLPWLEQIPSGWKVQRLKYLFRERDERSPRGEERLLSLRMNEGLVDHLDVGGTSVPPDALVGYKRVRPGQIVMNRMRATTGLFAVATCPGIVSPDYAVFDPKPGVDVSYFVRLFKTPSMAGVFKFESKGLGTGEAGFLRLYTDRFGRIQVPIPGAEEQATIVRFLDHTDRSIRRYIRAKRRLIALLNEQKQAIIHRAVTRGLDPDTPLKPSGVQWLGDVPVHWTVRRFKFLAKVTSGQVDPREPQHKGKILVAPNHIKSGIGRIAYRETAEEQGADSGKYEVRPGQIIYSKIRPNLRKVAIATEECLCSAD